MDASPEGKFPARRGGDEFLILVHEATSATVAAIVDRVQQVFCEPFAVDGHNLVVSASVGAPPTAGPGLTRLADADAAMYFVKRSRQRARRFPAAKIPVGRTPIVTTLASSASI